MQSNNILDQLSAALTQRSARTIDAEIFAAVALVVRNTAEGAEILVIERAEHPQDPWSGHLAFPGGRSEPSDGTLHRTAVRETLEEVGIDLVQAAQYLGPLDHQHARGSHGGLVVAPFVFALTSFASVQLDAREVARAIWLPVAPLIEGERDTQYTVRHKQNRYQMPAFRVENKVLWGLTYQMLRSLLELAEEQF